MIGFGAVAALCLLEGILQCGHLYAIATRQSSLNTPQSGLRILCLGESTTESGGWENPSSWPKQLEAKIRSSLSTPITVYNRGVVGTNSKLILESLPNLLRDIRPHLVLTMIGINDDLNVLTYETERRTVISSIAAHSRLYRFLRMLLRTRRASPPRPDTQESSELQNLLRKRGELQTAGDRLALVSVLEELAEKDPSTPIYYYGFLQDMIFRPLSAEDRAKVVRAVTGEIPSAPVTRQSLEKITPLINASNLDPLSKLQAQVEIALGQGDKDEAAILLSRQTHPVVRIFSQARLCALRLMQDKDADCWNALLQLVQEHPALRRSIGVYLTQTSDFKLASLFLNAEEESELAREDSRSRGVVLRQKALALWMSGNLIEARRLFEIDDTCRMRHTTRMTLENYPAIINQIKKTGARVVAIQYPMLSVSSLKALLAESPPDGFIDQEAFFKEQVLKRGYLAIFSDVFAGSFGHTRALGNSLIADNVFTQLEPILTSNSFTSHLARPFAVDAPLADK